MGGRGSTWLFVVEWGGGVGIEGGRGGVDGFLW